MQLNIVNNLLKRFFTGKSFGGSKFPYIIIIFFAIVVAINIIYIIVASDSWRGLAIKNSYKKGLNYNQTIAQAEKQKELGWKINYQYKSSAKNPKKGKFIFYITDEKNNIIKDIDIIIKFSRPVQEGYDFMTKSSFKNNSYFIDVEFPMLGNWNANILAYIKNSDKEYRIKRKFTIK
jgi:nitrogen fixation protein FixH